MTQPYEPQVDRMLAALREIPRDHWHDSLTAVLFVAYDNDTVEQMQAFADHLNAWTGRGGMK
jgi:hypothetical protein